MNFTSESRNEEINAMNIIAFKKINASDIALVPPDLMVDEGKTPCSFRCLAESDVRAII